MRIGLGMKQKRIVQLLYLTILLNVHSVFLTTAYVPTEGWRTSTPAEVGMDAAKLDEMRDHINNLPFKIDSVTIIRHGWIVVDEYYDYYSYGNLHTLNCVTRTVTTVLIGIANKSGFISNLDEPIVNVFSNRTFANMDERKKNITIRHLLAMKSGLTWEESSLVTEWPDSNDYIFHSNTSDQLASWKLNPTSDIAQILKSNDWVQYILDKPMKRDPGTSIHYSFADSYLLQAIINQKTGMSSQTFAETYLFAPLNITDYHWWKDPQGVLWGAGGLWLHPHDIAKIGYLSLNNGTWGEEVLVQKEFVQESVTPQGIDNYGYKRGWAWYSKYDYYLGNGMGGQLLLVKPKDELIVVITSSSYLDGYSSESNIISWYIIPALSLESETSKSTTTTTAGLGSLSLLVAVMFLIHWHKRKK